MRLSLVLLVLCGALCSVAQQPNPQDLVKREFGSTFTVDAKFAPLYGDFDNDGQEDAAIVVTSKTPLADENDFHYRAIDPYDAYWGWGNPRDTIQFSATSVGPPRYLAVIHDWRAPKQKFLVVNLPFESLTLSRVALKKKKTATSIHAADRTLESDLYWDGKKYKWVPGETL